MLVSTLTSTHQRWSALVSAVDQRSSALVSALISADQRWRPSLTSADQRLVALTSMSPASTALPLARGLAGVMRTDNVETHTASRKYGGVAATIVIRPL